MSFKCFYKNVIKYNELFYNRKVQNRFSEDLHLLKFVNAVLKRGKRFKALNFYFNVLSSLKLYCFEKKLFDLHRFFIKAINNIKPCIYLKIISLGGNDYKIPNFIFSKKQLVYAIL